MIPTPDLSHLKKADYESVYEPAGNYEKWLFEARATVLSDPEDTFILLDALEKDAGSLRASSPRVCLEIGSGSGCVSAFLGTVLGAASALYLCTDINPHAIRCTHLTGVQNKIPINPVLASLASPLRRRLERAVDILVFNPPYVPTYDIEATDAQDHGDIAGAWAGGELGMRVTDVLLEQVEGLLSPHGRFYLVAVKQNNAPAIQARMRDRYGLDSAIVLQRRAGGEHLFVLRFTRRPPTP